MRILLTLATGTGKTFIAFQIAWKLFHARWNLNGAPTRRPRILFLADRNILANQAYNAFSAFPEDALVRIEPEPCKKCGCDPCVCGKRPCQCQRRTKVKVKLADGKERAIQHMMMTSFWHPDGMPMSAQQFMEMLFGKLPDFFKDEDELRSLWSVPDTRAKLMEGLAEGGFGHEQMTEMQAIIDAEKSDLFDVLAYVAYALPPLTREERATTAKVKISNHFNIKQQVFLEFVLSHYVNVGGEELDAVKLNPLLRLKYHDSLPDAVADLGAPKQIQEVFIGFQKFLYGPAA